MNTRNPTLREVVTGHIADALAQLRVSMPGRVESYDASACTVDVVPQLRRPVRQETGELAWVALPKVSAVPVLMPMAGGRRVKLPVAAGDIVLLIFSDFSMDDWKSGAGADDPLGVVTPLQVEGHQVADAIAIPGLFNPVSPGASDSIEVQDDGTVIVNAGTTKIGPGAGSTVEVGSATSTIKLGAGTNPVAYVGAQVQAGPFAGVITAAPLNLTTKV